MRYRNPDQPDLPVEILEVDFDRVALDRSAVAWVQPGQVQRCDLRAGVEGWLLMFTADVLETELVEAVGPRIPLGDAGEDVAWLLDRMRRLSGEPAPRPRSPGAARGRRGTRAGSTVLDRRSGPRRR